MIPLLNHPENENPDPRQAELRSLPAAAENRTLVLIVEDDAPMARMIAATLARRYRVSTACDGQEGIEQALALRPDLILCDVSMPRMSGEQLVKALRKRPDFEDVPIVVLSGRTDEQLRVQLLHAGAQDYLVKPFNREELRVRVANLLLMRQSRGVLQREVTQQSQNLADLANEVVARKRESEQVLLALQESETNFRFLTDSMPQVVWTTRADGQVDYYNQRWFDYTGLTYEHPQQWGLALHPDDLQQCREAWRQVIATGTAFEIKYRLKRASDGAYRWHLGRALPVRDTDGNIIKWFGTSTDIDGQIRTEEALRLKEARLQETLHGAEANYAQLERTKTQLRAIIDASREAMLFLSPDGRPLKVNARFTDFFGLDDITVLSQSAEQLVTLLKALFEASDSLDRSLDWNTADQEHLFREQQVQVGPGGREFDYSSLPVMNVDQTYIGRLYVWHDVTHEREVDRMKSKFVSTVSHELRTPLTSIKGYIDLLLTDDTVGELTELQQEFLLITQNNARRLETLVNDLLDLSHMESGKMELHRSLLDITLLIRELMPSFQAGWDARRQTFTLHLPEPAPIVLADADRVTQILSNLLSNAHKYTPEGGHIDLSVETTGPIARVAITDSGIGLSTEEQARLFTRFYRAHNTITEAGGGTGLGLSITRSLVEMQGGEIQVTSEPGHGSTFRFTLPLACV
jgi:PAS domain S-box-containing protein